MKANINKKILFLLAAIIVFLSIIIYKSVPYNSVKKQDVENINNGTSLISDNIKIGDFEQTINGKTIKASYGVFKYDQSSKNFLFNDKKIEGKAIAFKITGESLDITSPKIENVFLIKDVTIDNSYYLINYKKMFIKEGTNINLITARVKKADENGLYLEDDKYYTIKNLTSLKFVEDKDVHKYNPKDFPQNTLVSIAVNKNSQEANTIIRFFVKNN